jgi:DNA-binding NarL/FixJ family response regulator
MSKRVRATTSVAGHRILLVSEHPVFLAGMRACLRRLPGIFLHEVTAARPVFDAATKIRPDLVVIDLTPPTQLSFSFIKDLLSFHPHIQVLVFSTQDEQIFAERAIRSGARGYVMERAGCEALLKAARQVLAGHLYLSAAMSEELLLHYTARSSDRNSPVAALSQREFEVFALLGQGRSSREIAHQMHLSEKTIAVHRNHIRTKLNLRTPAELMQYAVRWQESKAP